MQQRADQTDGRSHSARPQAGARLLIVDASGYVYRAFFALPPMTRPDGTPIQAVYGFCNMLLKLMQDHSDASIVVVFDTGKPSFREKVYADYKAQREAPPPEMQVQFPIVRQAAEAFGLPIVEVEGFEADDVIAAIARRARKADREVVIVSSDKDLMQLIGDGIAMWDPMKNRPIGPEEVRERFGVGPEKVRDVLALAGDASDNVPGVPGIGMKTAAQLIEQFGSLEALLARLDDIKQPKRRQALIENADRARLSYELVGLAEDVPLPFDPATIARVEPDPKRLLQFFRENGFKSLIARLEQVAEEAESAHRKLAATAEAPRFIQVRDVAMLCAIMQRALENGVLAVDLETDSLAVEKANIVGICLAVTAGEGFYVPVGHVDEFGQRIPGQLDLEQSLKVLAPVLNDPSVLKVGHNFKFDLAILARHGLEVAPIDDTMLVSYAVNGTSHGHGLDELARRYLGYETIPYEVLCGRGSKQITFDRVSVERAADYGAEDAEVTFRLWRTLRPFLIAEHLATVYETLDRPLVPIVARMERLGIRVDKDRLQQLASEFTQRMAELEERAYALAGRTFNLGSPKQLGDVLFAQLGLNGGGRKTSTGALSTSADVLEELAAQGHELPRVILEWRQLQKLVRTYCEALIAQAHPQTGRVHTSFNLAATSTGRLSSSDPNLQNIPIRTEEGRKIRAAFIPEDGFVLLSADYSQIELRIVAHVADVPALKEAFAQGLDIHAAAAARMFDVPPDKVDHELRRAAKVINYGIIYGIGAWGLAQRLGIPQDKARQYIDAYFQRYPEIRAYMDRAIEEARQLGYVRTLYGRRCFIADINHRVPSRRNAAERQAINAPIQGTAADIMKRAMIRVDRRLRQSGLGARMLLQVHDELVLEVPEDEVEDTAALVRETMAQAAALSVPLEVDVGFGRNWEEAH